MVKAEAEPKLVISNFWSPSEAIRARRATLPGWERIFFVARSAPRDRPKGIHHSRARKWSIPKRHSKAGRRQRSRPLGRVCPQRAYMVDGPICFDDVTEGARLSFKGNRRESKSDPTLLGIQESRGSRVLSGSTMHRHRGGRPLGKLSKKEDLTNPGMLLIVSTSTGGLRVQSEVTDQREISEFSPSPKNGVCKTR